MKDNTIQYNGKKESKLRLNLRTPSEVSSSGIRYPHGFDRSPETNPAGSRSRRDDLCCYPRISPDLAWSPSPSPDQKKKKA